MQHAVSGPEKLSPTPREPAARAAAPLLLKQREAAAYLGVSSSFLEKRRVYGGGPRFAKIGRRVAYRQVDLDAWVEARMHESTSEAPARASAAA